MVALWLPPMALLFSSIKNKPKSPYCSMDLSSSSFFFFFDFSWIPESELNISYSHLHYFNPLLARFIHAIAPLLSHSGNKKDRIIRYDLFGRIIRQGRNNSVYHASTDIPGIRRHLGIMGKNEYTTAPCKCKLSFPCFTICSLYYIIG